MINASEIFAHVDALETEVEQLRGILSHSVDADRFVSVGMTAEEAARFLDMRPTTVRDYARRGLLERHPDSTDARLLLKASSVLRADPDGLRRAKRTKKWRLN